ncbi:MAG: hypothetical protein ACKVOX_11990 [Rhizobacter sp.]
MQNGNLKRLTLGALLTGFMTAAVTSAWAAEVSEEASTYVAFVQEFAGNCVARNGVQILVRNTHPTRSIRVWLDRYHMGSGTGDRSRSELLPSAEPEPLGCSRTADGPQEWRLVRAIFVD